MVYSFCPITKNAVEKNLKTDRTKKKKTNKNNQDEGKNGANYQVELAHN